LSVSDEILNCQKCEDYAKKIDPHNWRELFNIAWLKIRERELKDHDFSVRYYKTYFQTVLYNCKMDLIKTDKKIIRLNSEKLDLFYDESDPDKWIRESAALHTWINRKPNGEFDLFLRNIITLTLHSKCRKDAIDLTGMSKRSFQKYLKQAKQKIKNEYNHSDHSNNTDLSYLV
jgi:hypothetical protein